MIWPRRYISMVRYILIKLQIMFWLWDGADLSTLSCAKAASVMSCVWQCSSFKWCYVWTKVVIADIQDMSCFQLCIWTIDHLINHLRLEAFLLQEAGTVWKTGVCTALWLYPELLKQSDHKDTKGTVWSSFGIQVHYSTTPVKLIITFAKYWEYLTHTQDIIITALLLSLSKLIFCLPKTKRTFC